MEEIGYGPPIVCLHGLGGSAQWFLDFGKRLQKHYRVVALDLSDFGADDASRCLFSLTLCEERLSRFLAERFSEPVNLLGHSMGTIVALRLAAKMPKHIRSLVLSNGLPEVTVSTRERLIRRIGEIRVSGMAGFGSRVSRANFSPSSLQRIPEVVAQFEKNFESLPVGPYVEAIQELLGYSAVEVLSQIHAPSLLLTGAEDGYAPPDAVREFADRLPGKVEIVILENCGHLPFIEAPERFAGTVKTFLEAQSKVTS